MAEALHLCSNAVLHLQLRVPLQLDLRGRKPRREPPVELRIGGLRHYYAKNLCDVLEGVISTSRDSGREFAGEPVGAFPIGSKVFNCAAERVAQIWATSSEDMLKIGYRTLVVDVDVV